MIFLHLLDFCQCKRDFIVPKSITQKGIQNAVNCNQSVISRILKKNEEEGNIYRVLKRIENSNRKQNAYFLSDIGIPIAEEIRRKIPD